MNEMKVLHPHRLLMCVFGVVFVWIVIHNAGFSGGSDMVERNHINPDNHVNVEKREAVSMSEFWRKTSELANSHELYPISHDYRATTHALQRARITAAAVIKPQDAAIGWLADWGSSHKWLLTLEGNHRAIFKPVWYRNASDNWYEGFDNPVNEVMFFHLDRLLGFRQAPFSVGRQINIYDEILPVASEELKHYLHKQDREICVVDTCYLCERPARTCTYKGLLTGAVISFVYNLSAPVHHPWDLSNYHRHMQYGPNNMIACNDALQNTIYQGNQRHFSQLVDMAISDAISNHFDSKYYYITSGAAKDLAVFLDRGRRMRRDTYERLMNIDPSHLATRFWLAVLKDVLLDHNSRIKLEKQAKAVEQRIRYMKQVLRNCVTSNQDPIWI